MRQAIVNRYYVPPINDKRLKPGNWTDTLRFEPQSTQRAQRKRKALLSALRVLCGSNSNLSTCINPHVYGAFKLKSVPLGLAHEV